MRLLTLAANDTSKAPDGELAVASSDGLRYSPVKNVPTLLAALQNWSDVQDALDEARSKAETGSLIAERKVLAPLPRTFSLLDGSAFIQHVLLVRKARGVEPPPNLYTVPLMYQGASDHLLGAEDPFPLPDEAWGLDFEAEIAVVLGEVPLGIGAGEAEQHIKLFLLMNDWSYRNLIPKDLETGFGFFHGKPTSSFSPFALTPDELGNAFKDGRVHLPLTSKLNGAIQGSPNANEMHFSFFELIAHAARTRALPAGTILGSGTVSNADRSRGVSCLAEKRTLEQLDGGVPTTPFLKVGDRIEMEMCESSRSLFGKLDSLIVSPGTTRIQNIHGDRKE